MADNEEKNLKETKLTNEKLGQLTNAINEQTEDAAFEAAEREAESSAELSGGEERAQEEKAADVQATKVQSEQTSLLKEITDNGKKAASDSKGAGKLFGGAIGGAGKALGGTLSGLGMGIGAAGAGIGVALLGAATFAEKIADLDGKKIKENIVEIMSIPDSVGGNLEMMAKGGALTLALTGLGIGLAVFGAGSAGAAGAAAFTDGSNFAGTIKEQLVELLSISDALGGNASMLKDGGALTLALAGIGIGLAIFGAGSTIAGVGDGIKTFTGTGNFAENIKDQVITLLSISDELGGAKNLMKEGGSFFVAMAGIGAGLAIFGVGAAIASIGQGLGDGIAKFSDTSFAQGIKDNVITLLSISDELGGAKELMGEAGTFFLAMAGIGAGLAIFGLGAAVASIGQGLGDGIAKFSDTTFAQNIVDNVTTLLSISDLMGGKAEFLKEGGSFFLAMTGIGAGLAAFGVGGGIGAFADGVGKLFGGESPMDKILRLADNADNLKAIKPALESAAEGIGGFGEALEGFGSDEQKQGVKTFMGFLADLDNGKRLQNLEAFTKAIPAGFSMTFDKSGGSVSNLSGGSDNTQGAAIDALQNDTLERIAAAAEAQLQMMTQNNTSNTNNNVSSTTVNNSITPDRDLTMSMYGMPSSSLV